jgi:hypothetical protein
MHYHVSNFYHELANTKSPQKLLHTYTLAQGADCFGPHGSYAILMNLDLE